MKLEPIIVRSARPPTVEVDWAALAAYIRFGKGKVAKTVRRDCDHCLITIDLDRQGRLIGIETIGETNIEIGAILKRAAVQAPHVDFSKARYMRPHVGEDAEAAAT